MIIQRFLKDIAMQYSSDPSFFICEGQQNMIIHVEAVRNTDILCIFHGVAEAKVVKFSKRMHGLLDSLSFQIFLYNSLIHQ